jgi:putative PIN family toxin of toxin-antitoxin system
MRIVIDTNVIVSAFLWGGFAEQVIVALRDGRVTGLLTPALLNELIDVLSRKKSSQT